MAHYTFEEIATNPTRKMYTEHKLALLAPHFNGTHTIDQIAALSGRTKKELNKWLRDDLSVVVTAIASKDRALSQLQELLTIDGMSANELFARSDHYQSSVIGDVSVRELAVILGRPTEEVQSHIDRLYHKVIAKLRHKDELAEQFRTTMMKPGVIGE